MALEEVYILNMQVKVDPMRGNRAKLEVDDKTRHAIFWHKEEPMQMSGIFEKSKEVCLKEWNE